MSEPLRRAIGYVRVSTATQSERGTSLQEQRERIERYCREHSLELSSVVEDRGVSGGLSVGETFAWESRPSVMQLMDDAEAGLFDVLVVAKLDRLARDHATQVVLRRMLARHGVVIVSTAETNGDSAEARLQANIVSSVAEYERELISQRLRLGKARRKSEGRHVHGRAPYGYRSDAGRLALVPGEADVVKRIYALATDGESSGAIAKALNEAQVAPRSAAKWTPVTIRSILKNDAYVGTKYGVAKAHPAIITKRVWNRAQETLASHRKR